jgi:hypothetical protein
MTGNAVAVTVKWSKGRREGMADPHANDPNEDPEKHMGEVIADPWDDPEQTDWRTTSLDLDDWRTTPLNMDDD